MRRPWDCEAASNRLFFTLRLMEQGYLHSKLGEWAGAAPGWRWEIALKLDGPFVHPDIILFADVGLLNRIYIDSC
jgi:hypothetical protein